MLTSAADQSSRSSVDVRSVLDLYDNYLLGITTHMFADILDRQKLREMAIGKTQMVVCYYVCHYAVTAPIGSIE